jgi:hypothetical protein
MPVAVSQSSIVPSVGAETSSLELGEKATNLPSRARLGLETLLGDVSVCRKVPGAISQSCATNALGADRFQRLSAP